MSASAPTLGDSAPGPVLVVDGVSHSFVATDALSGVDLEVRSGEVVALLGANGAGKSTLIKILAGVIRPSAGRVVLGEHVFERGPNTADARNHGLAFIHQDLGLLGEMSVAENIAHVAGFATSHGFISWRGQRRRAAAILERWELAVDPDAPVKSLDASERPLVAIARALACDARVLVFDEPTAALPQHGAEVLFTAIERLRAAAAGILYVTHRLREVERLADRVVVMRDGRVVGRLERAEVTHPRLVELIVGGTVAPVRSAPAASDGQVVLRVAGAGSGRASDVSFELHRGEIVAMVGLVGAGQRDVGRMIAGAQSVEIGQMWVGGARYAPRSPRQAQARGVAYLPADRAEGGFPIFDGATNLVLRLRRALGLVRPGTERRIGATVLADYGVIPGDPRSPFGLLSGGNQQKVLLAKWITALPGVLVAEEPMAGVDVGAKRAIQSRIVEAAREGLSVVLISSDVDEVLALAHRAIVFAHGRPVTELRPPDLTPDRIALECFGG